MIHFVYMNAIDQNLQTVLLITLNISLIVSNIMINIELYIHRYTESIYFNDVTYETYNYSLS